MPDAGYHIHFCWNGDVWQEVDCIEVYRETFEVATDIWPYDVIDENEHNIWFDYGDE